MSTEEKRLLEESRMVEGGGDYSSPTSCVKHHVRRLAVGGGLGPFPVVGGERAHGHTQTPTVQVYA